MEAPKSGALNILLLQTSHRHGLEYLTITDITNLEAIKVSGLEYCTITDITLLFLRICSGIELIAEEEEEEEEEEKEARPLNRFRFALIHF